MWLINRKIMKKKGTKIFLVFNNLFFNNFFNIIFFLAYIEVRRNLYLYISI